MSYIPINKDGDIWSKTVIHLFYKSFDGSDHARPSTDANVHKSTFTIDGFSRVAMSTEFNWNGTSWVKQSQKHYVYDGLVLAPWSIPF